MAIYSFTCAVCGNFTEMRSMSLAREEARCPLCGRAAERVFAVPYVSRIDPAIRRAHEINEKSAHEPRVVNADDWNKGARTARPYKARHTH